MRSQLVYFAHGGHLALTEKRSLTNAAGVATAGCSIAISRSSSTSVTKISPNLRWILSPPRISILEKYIDNLTEQTAVSSIERVKPLRGGCSLAVTGQTRRGCLLVWLRLANGRSRAWPDLPACSLKVIFMLAPSFGRIRMSFALPSVPCAQTLKLRELSLVHPACESPLGGCACRQ